MPAAALEVEVSTCTAELADERDEDGRRLVVRNGYRQPRQVTTAAGAAEVKAPRVNGKRVDEATGEHKRFASAILTPWCRKSPKSSEVLPLPYLHGLSPGDFVPALEQFLGSSAGLSPATITRLTQQGQADHKAFGERDLTGADYVYVRADGIHPRIRLAEAKSCVLVVTGVRADGTKELIAMADGYRESTDSWADLLRDAARRGMRAPVLTVGDGALVSWGMDSLATWIWKMIGLRWRETGRFPFGGGRDRDPRVPSPASPTAVGASAGLILDRSPRAVLTGYEAATPRSAMVPSGLLPM